MSVYVTELDPISEQAWESYVARHRRGTLFHTLLWRDAIEEAFGHESRYLTAWRDDALVGIFPLTRVLSRMAGRILVSVPYAVYGGVLADDDEVSGALLAYAQRLANRMGARWVDIRSVRAHWSDLPVVNRYVTFQKPLPDEPEDVLAQLPRKARAAARQARERHGLTTRFDDRDLTTVWSLYSQSMRRLASPNYPMKLFHCLLAKTTCGTTDAVDEHGIRRPGHLVQLILHKDKPIAGLFSFIYRDTLMPYFAGTDERFARMHPSHLMYLAAMERGVEIGCRTFDFGRSRVDNAGSYNFKRFQGFDPTPLEYQYYVPAGGRVPDLTPTSRNVQLARRIWPRLPLALTRPLGSWLAKSIPG